MVFFAEVSSMSGWYCQVNAKIFSKLRPSKELVCFRNPEQAPVQLGHEMLNGCLSQRWSPFSLFSKNVKKRMFKLHVYYYIFGYATIYVYGCLTFQLRPSISWCFFFFEARDFSSAKNDLPTTEPRPDFPRPKILPTFQEKRNPI